MLVSFARTCRKPSCEHYKTTSAPQWERSPPIVISQLNPCQSLVKLYDSNFCSLSSIRATLIPHRTASSKQARLLNGRRGRGTKEEKALIDSEGNKNKTTALSYLSGNRDTSSSSLMLWLALERYVQDSFCHGLVSHFGELLIGRCTRSACHTIGASLGDLAAGPVDRDSITSKPKVLAHSDSKKMQVAHR